MSDDPGTEESLPVYQAVIPVAEPRALALELNGFPPTYFVLRNRGSSRVFDVRGGCREGAEVCQDGWLFAKA